MEKLGIQPTLLLAQVVNFAIIVFVLTKFLFKPILKMLEKRKKEIEAGLAMTEKMREEEVKLDEKRAKLLDAARKDAQDIIEEARKQAKEEEKNILAAAHKEAEVIIEKGRADAAGLKEEMEKGVRTSAVTLAVAMAKRLLTQALSSDDKHKVLAKHLKELQSVEA